MVINDENKVNSNSSNRSVRPKLLSIDSSDNKLGVKADKKHRLKQRFEVIKKLGQGTYGKVQLAINKETGHEVAIKTIKKSKVENDQDLIRIRREIQIMSSIQHPHIIHIFEVFENKDKIVLVMQYANGGEVYDYVSARKVLSDYEARRLFRQIATAIYYCHKNKICHRDLKLENILLDEKGNAKIADFGLSNVFDDRHYLSTFCGSPLYASPEIVKGTPYYGPEVDCWSLGVLLYTLVYGAMPFDGSNFKRLVKQISDANYFEPKQKSDASELIRRLLTPNPAKRATIIDICTDGWVNKDYEHSLLQVAEDMANLTPVRLDILVALAPVSPTALNDQKTTNPLADQNIEPVNQEILKDATDEKEVEDDSNMDTYAKKRQASTSFDQSQTKVPSQAPRKKKTKKSENDSTSKVSSNEITRENLEKDKISVDSDDRNANNTLENNETIDNTEIEQLNNVTDKMPIVENIDTDTCETETILLKEAKTDNMPELSSTNLIQSLQSNIEPKEIESNFEQEIKIDAQPSEQNIDLKNEDFSDKSSEKLLAKENELKTEKIDDKEVISEQKSNLDNDVKDVKSVEKKKKVSRTLSTTKRPGKLSIPKLWDKSVDEPSSGSPSVKSPEFKSNLQSSDSKISPENKFQEKKVPFIPVGFKVSDAKKAFERRCSVPAINTSFSTFMRKNDGKQNKAISDKSDIKVKPKPPKLSLRSLSLNDELESPKKVKEAAIDITNLNKNVKSFDNENKNQTQSEDSLIEKVNDKEKKILAKDILKKTIAKAKLNEKRNSDSDSTHSSPVTTPLVSIENSSCTLPQSSFRIPRPFNKDNIEKVIVKPNTTIELKINPNILQQLEDDNIKSTIESEIPLKDQKSDLDVENAETIQPQEMKPITRSYKKVTFTKDGACVTETGKIYSAQGTDGTFTRVEKKSKVTHFPSQDSEIQIENNSNIDNNKFNIQRSDSLSSSGSTDIFEDIFDNHWSGDSIFPNMRSFFQGMIGSRKEKKSRRRSRAESCERNSSDWFSSGFGSRKYNSNLTDHESDTDNDNESQFSNLGKQGAWQQYLRPHGSLFDRSSIFSRHLSKDISREFDDPFQEFSRSLSRDRSTFSSRIHPSSYKVVFGTHATKSDDLDANSSFSKYDANVKSKLGERPRVWSRDLSDSSFSEKDFKSRFDNNQDRGWDNSRKRVEQWLQTDNNEDNDDSDKNSSYSVYGTVGPRGFRRYLRTLSGRSTQDKFKEFTNDSSINSRMSGLSRITNTSTYQSPTILSHKNKPVVELKFSLNTGNQSVLNSSSTLNDVNSINFSNCPTSPTLESSEFGDDFQTSITLPESSSLLDQLRTHGYRNIVSQRLCSGSSLLNDLEWKSTDSNNLTDTTDSNYKKGNYKNVFDSESSASDFKQNVCENACECMETNPSATKASATTNGAIASDANASCADCALKASEPITTAAHVESADSHQSNNDIVNLKLKHTVNQQSCEPSSRFTTYAARSTTTGDLPECNPNMQKNNSINNNSTLKETVQERIHRKSFYSRFNDDRPTTPRQRRRSFLDNDIIDSSYGNKYSLHHRASNFSSSSFRNSLFLDNHNSFGSKLSPSPSSTSWFNRMESRASQLMNDLMVNDKLNLLDDDFKSRDIALSNRRQSNSTVRSSYSTSRSLRSDYDSYSTSLSNNLSDNEDNNDPPINSSNLNSLLDEIGSPRQVLRRAINLLED